MTSKNRSLLAIMLFVPLAAVLLVTFACLPVPVGDPETSKVDPALVGAYFYANKEKPEDGTALAMMRQWDAHTYYVQYITVPKEGEKGSPQVQNYKGWLTPIGGATFLTLQSVDDPGFATGGKSDPTFWIIFRLEKSATGLEAKIINPDAEMFKDLMEKAKDGKAKRVDAEAILKAHVDDKGMYGDAIAFKKLGKDDSAMIDGMLDKAGIKPMK